VSDSLERLRKGRVAELNVISKLIDSGLEVYTPIIDKGIDCIIRVDGKPPRYYDIQIKRSLWNVSVRGARKILGKLKTMSTNYYLVIAIEKNEEYRYIYLTVEQIEEYHKKFPNIDEIDINVPAGIRDKLINSQSLDKLISILKGKTET